MILLLIIMASRTKFLTVPDLVVAITSGMYGRDGQDGIPRGILDDFVLAAVLN